MDGGHAARYGRLQQMVFGYRLAQAISVAARLGIADVLYDDPLPVETLASRTGTHPDPLYRLLRGLAAAGLFAQTDGRTFALTPLGALLRRGVPGSLWATAAFNGTQSWIRWAGLLDKVRTGEGTEENLFAARWARTPELGALFDEYMMETGRTRAGALLAGYEFSGCRRVVDVGGGRGQLLAAILKAYPQMRGVLFDLPAVIAGAQALLDAAGVANRCVCIAGDFFETVPAGGDLYVLSVVVHDWDDERAARLLRNCRQAMDTGARLLLVERVLPDDPTTGPDIFMSDLHMMVGPGGRERTVSEYRTLLAAAGFGLTHLVPLDETYQAIEARPQ